jgi:glycosyltransferase involved in cell wall biosynthesis
MDFTIITPSLNYGRFLGNCLESVASQSGITLEHLVFDAGSTDDSFEIASRFPHITWIQKTDSGMSEAINKGFDRARGDWVMWLNADDRLKPGVLAEMLQQLRESRADVVYGGYDFINESGDFLRSTRMPRWSWFVHTHHHCYIGSTAAFYRRASVVDAGFRLREDFRYVMDGEFYARLDAAGKTFERIPVAVADFRLHGGNASMIHLGKTRDMERILAAERQHVESRSIRRAYGFTLSEDPYLNGLVDGILWIAARLWKQVLKG